MINIRNLRVCRSDRLKVLCCIYVYGNFLAFLSTNNIILDFVYLGLGHQRDYRGFYFITAHGCRKLIKPGEFISILGGTISCLAM